MQKKVSNIAVLLVMALLMCGCEGNKGTDTALPSQTEQTEAPPSEGNAAVDRGSWDGDVFTSKFASLRFTKPDGWTAVSEEELASLMGIAKDILDEENKWIIESAKLKVIFDMVARDEITGNNVIVQYENLLSNPVAASMSGTEYLELLKKQMESLDEMDYSFDVPYSAAIAEIDFTGIHASEAGLGYEQYFYVRKQESYMVTIIVSLFDETRIDDIVARFS